MDSENDSARGVLAVGSGDGPRASQGGTRSGEAVTVETLRIVGSVVTFVGLGFLIWWYFRQVRTLPTVV
jgi:hypothetical protein